MGVFQSVCGHASVRGLRQLASWHISGCCLGDPFILLHLTYLSSPSLQLYFRTISHIQHHHTTRTTPDPTNMAHVRPLRVLTLALSALATPLLIGVTVVSFDQFRYRYYWHSSRQVTTWCFGFIPLALTAAASVISLIHYRKYGRMPNFKYTLIDLFAFVWYLALLIPIWATEIGKLNQPGWGLLAGYTTAPMIVNMYARNAQLF